MNERRSAVARALLTSEGATVSGEMLAGKLGVTRVAVAKHIAALRELGFEIESLHRSGYRLCSVPDFVLPETVGPLVTDSMWTRFEGGRVTTSTNDDAKQLARDGAPEGTVFVASRQESGRGRLGRQWSSPEGGAYFSGILRPGISPVAAPPLSLVVAVGAASGLEALGLHVRVKWPNDLMLDDRKLGGVLLEMSAEADAVEWVVFGVGINVLRAQDGHERAACVRDVIAAVHPATVAAAALDGIASAYRRFEEGGFAPLQRRYAARDVLMGRQVAVRDGRGGLIAEGEARGVDAHGRLLVGDQAVMAGEVTLRTA